MRGKIARVLRKLTAVNGRSYRATKKFWTGLVPDKRGDFRMAVETFLEQERNKPEVVAELPEAEVAA